MKLPQWLIVAFSFLLVTGTWVIAENAKGDFTLPANVLAGVMTAMQVLKAVLGLTTNSVSLNNAVARGSAKVVATTMLAAIGMVVLSGCLSNAPIVPVTPANQDAVSQCRTDSDVHNGALVGSLVTGAVGTAAGAVAVADSDPSVKNAMGITGASAAAVTAVGAGVIALTNQLYANGGCPQLLGPLPILGKDGKPIARGFVPGDLQ